MTYLGVLAAIRAVCACGFAPKLSPPLSHHRTTRLGHRDLHTSPQLWMHAQGYRRLASRRRNALAAPPHAHRQPPTKRPTLFTPRPPKATSSHKDGRCVWLAYPAAMQGHTRVSTQYGQRAVPLRQRGQLVRC